jgi:hypothetical protein
LEFLRGVLELFLHHFHHIHSDGYQEICKKKTRVTVADILDDGEEVVTISIFCG